MNSPALRYARKLIVLVVGITVLITGLLMVVLPGPAFIVAPTGLAILGLEFAWARRWLRKIRNSGEAVLGRRPEKDA